jgi:hypothetical protein
LAFGKSASQQWEKLLAQHGFHRFLSLLNSIWETRITSAGSLSLLKHTENDIHLYEQQPASSLPATMDFTTSVRALMGVPKPLFYASSMPLERESGPDSHFATLL